MLCREGKGGSIGTTVLTIKYNLKNVMPKKRYCNQNFISTAAIMAGNYYNSYSGNIGKEVYNVM